MSYLCLELHLESLSEVVSHCILFYIDHLVFHLKMPQTDQHMLDQVVFCCSLHHRQRIRLWVGWM